MQIIKQSLDAYLLAPKLIKDQRGWFEIPFSVQDLRALGLEWRSTFQLNHSFTTYKGTVRGPNYQEEPYGQAKVIRCVKGRLYSVGIELDRNSENFGKFVGFELSAENKYLMYLPKTYAHGFVTLEDGTELEYLTDNEYNYESAKSIKWDELGIDWTVGGQVEVLTDVMSDKNKNAPKLV
ncbi:MAG: dTDP-4-dehydrorhamnose 3,5-epimerase family protein [Lachnospiraceae bacterium]|nr:dTDP-4-dehydrorhamnose 3,5-epimerase family protein [Lachnospiraceae bacterium]